jgi:hypothetical protein
MRNGLDFRYFVSILGLHAASNFVLHMINNHEVKLR